MIIWVMVQVQANHLCPKACTLRLIVRKTGGGSPACGATGVKFATGNLEIKKPQAPKTSEQSLTPGDAKSAHLRLS